MSLREEYRDAFWECYGEGEWEEPEAIACLDPGRTLETSEIEKAPRIAPVRREPAREPDPPPKPETATTGPPAGFSPHPAAAQPPRIVRRVGGWFSDQARRDQLAQSLAQRAAARLNAACGEAEYRSAMRYAEALRLQLDWGDEAPAAE